MLCSHARSQPACFSGRHLPLQGPSGVQARESEASFKRALRLLVTAQEKDAKAEAEALRSTAAALRAKFSSFDRKNFTSTAKKQGSSSENQFKTGVEAFAVPFTPLKRDISTEVSFKQPYTMKRLPHATSMLTKDFQSGEKNRYPVAFVPLDVGVLKRSCQLLPQHIIRQKALRLPM